jgi:hypothetical protein
VLFAPADAREVLLTYGGRSISAALPRIDPVILDLRR